MKSANSLDAQDRRGTVTASDALGKKTGICWAKANLLAVLVRAWAFRREYATSG